MIIGVGMYAWVAWRRMDRMADLGLHGTEALFIATRDSLASRRGSLAGLDRKRDIENARSFVLARGFKHRAISIARSLQVTRPRDSRRPPR